MENLDNIFSTTTTTINNDNSIIGVDDQLFWLQQQQQQPQPPLLPYLINNSNNNTIETTNLNNDNINNNKEQQLLLDIQQQKEQQQIQMQQQMQQLQYYQIQQQLYNNNINNINLIPTSHDIEPILQTSIENNNNNNNNDIQYIPLLNFNNNNNGTNKDGGLIINSNTTNNTTILESTTTTNTNNNNNNNNNNKKIIDKEEKRKIDNRYYHKKFREKKKDQIKEIENQIAALTFENEQIKKENQSIKNDGGVESFIPTQEEIDIFNEVKNYVVKMNESLENNDDISLMYHLQCYQNSFSKIYVFYRNDILSIFHPSLQLVFAMLDYIPYTEPATYDILTGPGSDLWLNQFKKESGMTDDQSIKFDELRFKISKIDKQYLKERLELDSEVKKFLLDYIYMLPIDPLSTIDDQGDEAQLSSPFDFTQTKMSTCKPLNYGQCLEFVFKLENLKNKVFSGRILMMDFFCSLCKILTPRQEAMFYVRVHLLMSLDINNYKVLNHVWSSIMQSKTIFNIADSLERMVNGNKDNFTTIPTSPIFTSLKPATFNPPPKLK